MFIYLFSLAIAQANQVLVGYFIGEEKNEEVYKQTFKNPRGWLFVSLILSIVAYFGSDLLFGIFYK